MRNITGINFIHCLSEQLWGLPKESVVKAIGTNQTHFIILMQNPDGKEHKIYIPCEEN